MDSHKGSSQAGAPSWEKKFCTSVCSIPWEKICWAKFSLSSHRNILNWDDSAAFEAFQNSKSCYYAEINGLLIDTPLPDPDQYIDKIDYYASIDPKLIEDLENPESLPVFDEKIEVIFESEPMWGNAEDENSEEHHSVNWDKFVEKDGGNDNLWNNGWNNLWKIEKAGRINGKRDADHHCKPIFSKSRKLNNCTEKNMPRRVGQFII